MTIMRSTLFSLRRVLVTCVQARRYALRPTRCDAHMNELPVPCGPWDVMYKKKQAWYTKCLLAGFLWWAFSCGMMLYTGSFWLNCRAPAHPAASFSEADEECSDDDLM